MKFQIFLLTLIISSLVANPVLARNNRRSFDTSSLDDDVVDEIPLPVLFGVDYKKLVPDFGDPRGDGTRFHEGQDILAPQGTPVVSPTDALVISTGNGPSAGNYVYTMNPGGEVFRYMHLDYIADLDRGDKLAKGDFIGKVGDTGNAPDGVYHLHFEIHDENNKPIDPYPRMIDTFKDREVEDALESIFRDIKKDSDYAEFLLKQFPEEIKSLVRDGVDLPNALEDEIEREGLDKTLDAEEQLVKLLKTIPAAIAPEVSIGDDGAKVILLQIYLIYLSDGPARDNLVAAGSTGYFGSITESALSEYQSDNDLKVTGVYDNQTRIAMIK